MNTRAMNIGLHSNKVHPNGAKRAAEMTLSGVGSPDFTRPSTESSLTGQWAGVVPQHRMADYACDPPKVFAKSIR